MKPGYNTNGLAHHDLQNGLELLKHFGYSAVGLTIDYGLLEPRHLLRAKPTTGPAQGYDCSDTVAEPGEGQSNGIQSNGIQSNGQPGPDADMKNLISQLQYLLDQKEQYGLSYVIETGARFLLNPFVKHEPTLVSPTPEEMFTRIDFYEFAIDCAQDIRADCVSIWSGIVHDGASDAQAMKRLVFGLRETLDYAGESNVRIAFEPEPGMFIATMDDYQRLLDALDGDERLKLTIDVGHLVCNHEPVGDTIRKWKDRLINVHLDDMLPDRHEHLFFGEGTVDLQEVFGALDDIGYDGCACVELSRDSWRAPEMVQRSKELLQHWLCPAGT